MALSFGRVALGFRALGYLLKGRVLDGEDLEDGGMGALVWVWVSWCGCGSVDGWKGKDVGFCDWVSE